MKKLSIFLLLVLSLFVVSANFVVAEEVTDKFAGASYVESEIVETNNLPYGVNHIKVHGHTSTSMTGYDADGYGGATDAVVPGQLYDQQVNVMEVPSDEDVRITTWAYLHDHKWTLNSVRALINDYEVNNPGWKVVGAINGDFFDIGARGALPYQTNGALVSGGEFYKTTTGNLVGFRNDGSEDSLVGNETVERTAKMILSIYNNGEIVKEFDLDKINEMPGDGESSVFYSYYVNIPDGKDEDGNDKFRKELTKTEVTSNGYFVDNAELALPNNQTDFYGKGKISSKEAKVLSAGQFAIVSNNTDVNSFLDTDVEIRVQYKYVGAYAGINDITGGGTTIINNGLDSEIGLTDRAPRTVIGRKADGTIIMMVIDGRQSAAGMYGADRTELGAIMNYYGAVEAYNLDGGGSSTMIIRKDGELVVLNSPSDGRERNDANAILIVVKDPEIEIKSTPTTNNLTLDVNVVEDNAHDINELYVVLNNETKKVENNKVVFENLNSNTEYPYFIEYKDAAGEVTRIITSGRLKTHKITPVFEGIEVIERGDKFEFKVKFTDPDGASGYDKAELKLNGKSFGYLYSGQKSVSKKYIQEFDTITLTTFINIGDGNNTRTVTEIKEFKIDRYVDAYLQDIFDIHNDYCVRIYN